jgi:hypothetical protein
MGGIPSMVVAHLPAVPAGGCIFFFLLVLFVVRAIPGAQQS